MKKRIKRIIVLIISCLLIGIISSHIVYKENTIIYISSQRSEIDINLLKLYIDGEFKDTLNLNNYSDLHMYIYKDDFSFGNHTIELKSLDNKIYLKENFYYYGMVNWLVIGCYGNDDYSFNNYFKKPSLL